MSIVNKLAKALKEQNWSLVREAYYDLGGQTEDIKIDKVSITRTIAKQENEEEETNQQKVQRKLSQGNKLPIGKWKNKFKDDGKTAKKDKIFDKKVWENKEPVPRRAPAKKVSIECDYCNKIFKVYPKDIPPAEGRKEGTGYRCDNCLGG